MKTASEFFMDVPRGGSIYPGRWVLGRACCRCRKKAKDSPARGRAPGLLHQPRDQRLELASSRGRVEPAFWIDEEDRGDRADAPEFREILGRRARDNAMVVVSLIILRPGNLPLRHERLERLQPAVLL